MKYLIATEDESLESNVSSHFGKAPFFISYDDATKALQVKVNDDTVDPHLVIRDSAKSGMEMIICGGIGPHTFQVTEKFKVHVCITSGTLAREAVNLAAAGKLPITTGPTVQHSHHDNGEDHRHSHYELQG
jgi:predicted Fe-Mo cluster-binding NifX family protein